MLQLTNHHRISRGDERFEPLYQLTQLSNNLANTAHFVIRQHYFNLSGKNYIKDIASDNPYKYVNFYEMSKLLKETKNECYKKLPANTSQEVLKIVDREWSSFWTLIKKYSEGKLENKPNIPRYRKKGGTYVLVYNRMTFSSQKKFKEKGEIYLPKTNIRIQLNHPDKVKQVRIYYKGNSIYVDEIYDMECKEIKADNGRYMSIDLGISNLATCVSNVSRAFIIDGKYIKSVNRFYNKEIQRLYTIYDQQKISKSTEKVRELGETREFIIQDWMHKASRYIVDNAVENNINTIVIGHNKGWKDGYDKNDKTNQNFVQIPFSDLIFMITYKAKEEGIKVEVIDESYTSKCSFFDDNYIPTYGVDDEKFVKVGSRVKRGCFKTEDGFKFNADVNGALNILKKYLNKLAAEILTDRSLIVNPNVVRFDMKTKVSKTKVKPKKIKVKADSSLKRTQARRGVVVAPLPV